MMATEFDIALREQVYFEALKEYEADQADTITDEIIAALVAVLLKSGMTSFADVTKKTFDAFMRKAREVLQRKLGSFNTDFVKRMQEVVAVTLTSTKETLFAATGKRITETAFNGTRGANKKLWKRITGDVVPGIGHTPSQMVQDFTTSTYALVTRTLRRAYADNWTMAQLIDELKGTADADYRNGVLRKITNQAKHVTRTLMQHAKAFLSYNLGRIVYDRYQWISTIDSATTEICRHRHMKIFEYGKGPRPPAHINCRSVIVGILGNLANQAPASFFDWIKAQPLAFLRDVLTPSEVEAITSGTAQKADFNAYKNVRKLSPEQFGKRIARMIE